MNVILLERVEKLGAIGDVVAVKPGFARNFLLPRGKALRATEANKKRFEGDRERIVADNAGRRDAATVEAATIEGKKIILIRQASSTGQLYGSVSARDIAEALEADGSKVARTAVILDKPIKALGLHPVRVSLHPEVAVMIELNVARSPEEAELQAKGVNVAAEAYERDEAGFTEDYDPNAEPGLIVENAPAEAPAVEPAAA